MKPFSLGLRLLMCIKLDASASSGNRELCHPESSPQPYQHMELFPVALLSIRTPINLLDEGCNWAGHARTTMPRNPAPSKLLSFQMYLSLKYFRHELAESSRNAKGPI